MYESTPYKDTSPFYDPAAAMFDDDEQQSLTARIAGRDRIGRHWPRGLDDELLRIARSYRRLGRLCDPEHNPYIKKDRQYSN